MFRLKFGKGIIRGAGDIVIKQTYRPETVFNYPLGYMEQYRLVAECKKPFTLEMDPFTKPTRLETNNAKLLSFIEDETPNGKNIEVVLKNETPVKYIYIKFFKEFLIIKSG